MKIIVERKLLEQVLAALETDSVPLNAINNATFFLRQVISTAEKAEPMGTWDDAFGFNSLGFYLNQDELIKNGEVSLLYTAPVASEGEKE